MWPFTKGQGKGSKEKPAEPTLDERVDSTEEKIRRVDVQLARLKKTLAAPGGALAKESVRQQAMNLIKQKRLYQNHLNTLNQNSYNLDQINLTKDSYKTVMTTYDSMKSSHKELKAYSRKFDAGKIEKMKDKIDDLIEKSEEISTILGGVDDTYVDEDELDAELAILDEEIGMSDHIQKGSHVPAGGGGALKDDDLIEMELSQLDAELSKPQEEEPNLIK